MSGGSNNSWTIVTPEETAAAETLRPLAQAAERQDEPRAPADGFGAEPSDRAHGFSEEDQPPSEERVAKPNEDGDGSSLASSAPSKVQSSPVPEARTEDTPPVDSGPSSTEPESFSDSYTHLGPSSEQTPAPALTAETLGHLDSGQEEATEQADVQDETQHRAVRQELQPEEEEEVSKEETQQWSPIETPQDPTVQSPEAEPELRRRRRLAALEKIDRHDEEEEAEEDFQLPQRDEDSGITLNKCILGAVILLGLGTIFISGVVMDLDQENDYPPVELKDSESPGKPEWLNPDISQPGAEAGSAELLNKLNKGTEQIEMLQAQLQSQHEELNVAKTELEKIRTELESVSVLQKEVETLRSTLTQLTFSAAATTPSSGSTENNSQKPEEVHKKEKHDRGVAKEWKDAEKAKWKKEEKQRQDGGKPDGREKERKREKSEGGKFDKRQKEEKHSKQRDETEGWKEDKSKRGDEGKSWKEKKEKKEWTYEGDKKHKRDKNKEERSKEEGKYQKNHKEPADKHWKKGRDGDEEEEKEWSKEGDGKHKRDQFKEERSKKERDVKEGEYRQEKHKGPGDKRWKNGREDHKDERREKYEKKHWKESDGNESRNRKGDGERRGKSKEQKKWKGNDEKEWVSEAEEERNGGKKYEKEKERRGDETEKRDKPKDQTWTDEKAARSKPAVGQPEYWARQRARLQHSSKPPHNCHSPDSCARAEGLRAVPFAEFESVLNDYLSKARTAGVEAAQVDALQKLAAEVFPNGVFPHDKMSFQDYVEDVEDVLEDLVGVVEDEMEGFEEEVMQTFMLSALSEEVEEVKEESERGRG